MRPHASLFLPPLALAAALVACGGGVSRSAFATKADAACGPGNTAIASGAKPTTMATVASSAGTAAGTLDGQVAALRGLDLPGGGDKPRAEGLIAALADVGGPVRALQEAAAKNDEAGVGRPAADGRAKADGAATAGQAAGTSQCGTGLRPSLANLFDGTRDVLKAGYVAKGEVLCRDTARRTNALTQPGSTLSSLGRFIDRYLPLVTKLATDLKALPAPPGDEAAVGEMVAAMDGALPKIKEFGAAAKANNGALVAAIGEELDLVNTQMNAKFDAYGMKACGSLGEI